MTDLNKIPEGSAASIQTSFEEPIKLDQVEGAVEETASTQAPSEEGVLTSKNQFESNLVRIFKDEGHSKARTWAVRILSTLTILPLLFAVVTDALRYVAFRCNLVDGKSFSLVDKASAGVQSLTEAAQKTAEKVKNIYQSYTAPKVLSTEDLNVQFKDAITDNVKKLIDGYRTLNNESSFGSKSARNAEREIQKAKESIVSEINTYLGRNASGAEDFIMHLDAASRFVQEEILRVAGNDVYVPNKVVRLGPPPSLALVAQAEFVEFAQLKKFEEAYIALAKQEEDLPTSLKMGMKNGIVSEARAKEVVKSEIPRIYTETLKEEGLEAAEKVFSQTTSAAVEKELIASEEVESLVRIENTDALANAVAKDIASIELEEGIDEPEMRIGNAVLEASEELIASGRLDPEEKNEFVSKTIALVEETKTQKEEDSIREKELEEQREVERVAEEQRSADQQALVENFTNTLGYIHGKQQQLQGLYQELDSLDALLQSLSKQVREIRHSKVDVNGKSMQVLEAESTYWKQIEEALEKGTAEQKHTRIQDLAGQGLSEQAIEKINQLESLKPQILEVLGPMTELVRQIQSLQKEIVECQDVYQVFEKNHRKGLEKQNQETVDGLKNAVFKDQESLDRTYNKKIVGNAGIIARLKTKAPKDPVNKDREANAQRVYEIAESFKASQVPVEEEQPEPSLLRRIFG